MLIRFAVENYRSIKTKQELSLVASTLTDMADGLIDAEGLSGMRLLPAVVMYGANASGKSTLVSALNWMRDAILFSHRRSEPDGPIDVAPFLLDHAWVDKPTIFEIDFIVDNVRYHYGFEVDKKTFVSEWLFGYPNDRRQTLFERRDGVYSFGRNLKGQNKVIEDLVRPNSLFLLLEFRIIMIS